MLMTICDDIKAILNFSTFGRTALQFAILESLIIRLTKYPKYANYVGSNTA